MPVSRRTRHAEADAKDTSPPVRLADDGKTVVVEGDSSGESSGEEEEEDVVDDDDDEEENEDEGEDEGDLSADEDDSENEDGDSDAEQDEEDDEDEGGKDTQAPVKPQPQSSMDSKAATQRPAKPTPQPSTSSASSSTHLDPSLFQTYFQSQSQSQSQNHTPSSILKASSSSSSSALKPHRSRKSKSKGGIVTGRDGLPMKRLKDGRTILRALSGSSSAQPAPREDLVDKVAQSKAQKYKSRKLGLNLSGRKNKIDTNQTKPAPAAKSDDDPLGLNDPAFLPGGEFAHLANLTGAKKRKRRGKSTGGQASVKNDKRTQRVPTTSKLPKKSAQSGMPAFAFRRSAA